MKAILNYNGFIKEIEVKEPKPYILIHVTQHIVGLAEKGTQGFQQVKTWRFFRKDIITTGFWIFKKIIINYEFENEGN